MEATLAQPLSAVCMQSLPSAAQRKYGVMEAPIPATQVYRRVISTLRNNGIRVERWILLNERNHTVTFATTYNGETGSHYNPVRNTQWLELRALRARLDEYEWVKMDRCPIAVPADRADESNPLQPIGEGGHLH